MTRTLASAGVIAVSIACLFVLNSFFEPHFDFNSFWGAGRALLEGQNPYDYEVIQDILEPRATANFNYPLFIAVLVLPLGLFDLETAKNIWLTLSEVLFVLSIYLLGGRRVRSREFMLSTLACAAYVPTLIAFFDQQTSMVSLFLLSLVHVGLSRRRHALAGTALAMSLIKPQTMALVLLVTIFRLGRRGLVAFGVTLGAMLVIAFALMPDWPIQWWASASWITQEAGRAVPTIWGLSWHLFSQYWPGVVLLAGLLAAALLNTEFSFVLTVGLLLAVYMKPYDLVLLLIPALSRRSWKLLGSVVLASYLLLFYVAFSGRGGDVFILLTIITYAYLVYQDRALMVGRIRRFRSWIRLHLRA
ncbi:MAG TPA: glycosyltransferase family 87 protein [Anaerolineae bacterium]|nr:glycosyltransferase family 87 protein [Anaerolineae bacterium]